MLGCYSLFGNVEIGFIQLNTNEVAVCVDTSYTRCAATHCEVQDSLTLVCGC